MKGKRRRDLECGACADERSAVDDEDEDEDETGFTCFNFFERFQRRKRQPRYTMDSKKEIRAALLVVQAAIRYKESAERVKALKVNLGDMLKKHDLSLLQRLGGVSGVAKKLETNLETGIPGNEDIMWRKKVFGSNAFPRKEEQNFLRFLLEAFQDLTLLILMVAAVASLIAGVMSEGIKQGWYEGASILCAVFFVSVVSAVSDYRSFLHFQTLNEEKRNICLEVIRMGATVNCSIYDIVVGDVVPLKIGDQVPGDGVLISGHSLEIDESTMPGVSNIVPKCSQLPFLISGYKVAGGYGTMLVTRVGLNTKWGMHMSSIPEDTVEETQLQVRLKGLATWMGIVGLIVAFVILVVLLARYFSGHSKDADGTSQFMDGKTSLIHAIYGVIKIIILFVIIVVVAVPEGLPLAVSIMLAYLIKQMQKDKALPSRISACETMGRTTTICSDKTGFITMNQMTVVEAYANGKKLDPPNKVSPLSPTLSSLLMEGIAQNTTGCIFKAEGRAELYISGSPTEKAILSWGVKLGMNFDAERSESVIIHAIPFNSEKNLGGVAVKKTSGSEVHIHWKGAAESILALCTSYMDENDSVASLNESELAFLKKAVEQMAEQSLRCFAMAYRSYELNSVPSDEEQLSQWMLSVDELILLAIVGIKDPCLPEVKQAVNSCKAAGVTVRMVTGDNLLTAKAIALECGILASVTDAKEPYLIEGRTFRNMSEPEREAIAKNIIVMERSSPNDKHLLFQALKKKGHVVAVTGDGPNDVQVLCEADIGLAMGIAGIEVAKDNSDIILDDNFASVVEVARWGRSVYSNIHNIIQFQLTVNMAGLLIDAVAAISTGDVPLNAVQLLWINVMMDTLGALALATEPPTDHILNRPFDKREPLITVSMWRNLLIQVIYQVTVLLALYFRGRIILQLQHEPYEHASKVKNTVIFNAFVLCQIFNKFNARKPDQLNIFKGVFKNKMFMGITTLTLVLQIVIVEFLGKFVKTARLSWQLWLVCFVIGVISWPLDFLRKLLTLPKSPQICAVLVSSFFIGVVIIYLALTSPH